MPELNINLISTGILVIFIGFVIVFIGTLMQSQKSDAKVAVGGFIGFIPFGWSNDKRLLWAIIGLTALIALFWFFMQGQFRHP